MGEHSEEPWFSELDRHTKAYKVRDPAGRIVAETRHPASCVTTGNGEEDARRIVACVNACCGMRTEALEKDLLAQLYSTAMQVLAESVTPAGVRDVSARKLGNVLKDLTK